MEGEERKRREMRKGGEKEVCRKERKERKKRKCGLYNVRKILELYFGVSDITCNGTILRYFLATYAFLDTGDDYLYTLAVSPSRGGVGVADNTHTHTKHKKNKKKTVGVILRSSRNDKGPSRVWMALLEQHSPSSHIFHNLRYVAS